MLGYEPPPPRFWKALLVVAFPVALVAWSLPLVHIKLPSAVLIGGAIFAWLAIAVAINSRVTNDWRAQDTMNLEEFQRQTSVAPNTRVEEE